MGEFKRSAQELKRSIDVDTTLQDVKSSTTDLKGVIKGARREKSLKNDPDDANKSDKTDTPSDANEPSVSENTPAESVPDKEAKNG